VLGVSDLKDFAFMHGPNYGQILDFHSCAMRCMGGGRCTVGRLVHGPLKILIGWANLQLLVAKETFFGFSDKR